MQGNAAIATLILAISYQPEAAGLGEDVHTAPGLKRPMYRQWQEKRLL